MDWVSFDEIKRTVSLQMVLDHYGIRLRNAGPNTLRGKCPLPTHASKTSTESFTATLSKGVGGDLGMPVAIVHQIARPCRRQRARFRRRDGKLFRPRRGDQITDLVSGSGRGQWPTAGWQGTSRGKFRGQGTEGRTCFERNER